MGKKNKERVAKERTPLEPVPDSVTDGDSKFARALGSGDYHTRDRGLKALAAWLQSQDSVELDSLQKLWKGILYCFWHSDKEPVQRDLALRLASLLSQVQDEVQPSLLSATLPMQKRNHHATCGLAHDMIIC